MHTYVSFVRRGRSAHRRRTNHGGDASWPFLESFLASPLPGTRVDINEPEQIIFSPLAIGDHGVVGKANLYNPYPPLPPSPPPPLRPAQRELAMHILTGYREASLAVSRCAFLGTSCTRPEMFHARAPDNSPNKVPKQT